MLGPLGLPELLLITGILLLLFGANRLPGVARALGESIKGFKESISDSPGKEKNNPGDDF